MEDSWSFRVIVNHLPTLLAERRLKVADAVRATGVSKTTLHMIYNDQSSRIDFDTIDKLCEYLEVGVGDIFEYVEENKAESFKK
ncbi:MULTISPECIES: helix-turn-helix domain-containing protein [unclassified Psychrobacter]|uniref:helix-turn-helix domain-containing protein n=1 Tax=unclassified Psychrobacter TaxID=196806 RepID=UPI003F45F360